MRALRPSTAVALLAVSTLHALLVPAPAPVAAAPAGCSGGSNGTGENGGGQVACPILPPPTGGDDVPPPATGGDPGTGTRGGDDEAGCPDPETLPDNVACDVIEGPAVEGEAAPLPAPEDVAQGVLLRAVVGFAKPDPLTDPPVGAPSLLDLPTFVAVANWQDEVTDRGCDPTGQVCVTLTATPQLTFDPGEPGQEPIDCPAGGTRFDPDGAEPRVQAEADGACAHVYSRRTGVGDRPARWPGVVAVTWAFQWELEDGSQSGTLPPVTLSEDLPREVQEVQSVNRQP